MTPIAFYLVVSGPSLVTNHASRSQLKCPHNTARPGQHADRSRNVTIERFHTIQSVISPRRRVRGPGLQKLVGRVPSRGAVFDVVYKTGYNGSLAVAQAACQTECGEPQPGSTGPRRLDSSASLLWHRFPMIFAAPLRPPEGASNGEAPGSATPKFTRGSGISQKWDGANIFCRISFSAVSDS